MASATVLAAAMLVAGMAWSSGVAQADYEQMPEHFGVSGEAAQLQNATAIAINTTGAGGVEPGTFYLVGQNNRVVRFGPGSEGEAPPFREAWGWGVGNNASEYQRCGPVLVTEGAQHTFHTCTPAKPVGPFGGEESGHFDNLAGVAVNQVTGDVYVLNENKEFAQARERHKVEVFTSTGTAIGAGFGDAGAKSPLESIAEGPGKVHSIFPLSGAIAVDNSGVVYLTDADYGGVPIQQARVMSFEPQSSGDYEHYVYTGQSNDIVTGSAEPFTRLGLVGGNRLVAGSVGTIREYALGALGGGNTLLCSLPVSGQLQGMATNPVSGEVFYSTFGDRKIHRLESCDVGTGKFKEAQAPVQPAPETKKMFALALNPGLAWGPLRPPGTLYVADSEKHTSPATQAGIGDVLAPAQVHSPAVGAESVANTSTNTTTLKASINPHGFTTGFRFQYLSEAEYEANEPDERQSLRASAGGGLLGLGFEGRSLGGGATANLSAGSKIAEGLLTAKASADLKAAKGTATMSGAVGKGTVISGSNKVTAAAASEGAFAGGQTIAGEGIPAGTSILAVAGSELTLSAAATKSLANTPLNAGTATLANLTATEGAFEAGQTISGEGIPGGTTILAASATELTLSNPVTKPGTAVAIVAGSTTLGGLVSVEGAFEPGAPIAGEGIPVGTTIVSVKSSALVISNSPTKPGVGVAISSSGPAPLAVGEAIEGPGIPAGTTVVAAQAGKLTLSNSAEATVAGAHLRAGLPFDATAARVQSALERLATIGAGNVSVSGGPGDETGSSPYEITFTGALTNTDLPELSVDASALSGGSATATVTTEHDGGGGFASGTREAPAGGGSISGGGVATAAAAIAGLSPDTEYRFRALATSECNGAGEPLCEDIGTPAAFATYPNPTTPSPDGRRYELVSPAQKNGGEVFPADPRPTSCLTEECKPPSNAISEVFPIQSAPGGNAVTFMGFPFSPTEGAAVFNSYLSRRTATGWQTTALSPPLQATKSAGTLAFDDQLGEGLIGQASPVLAPGAPAGYPNFYLQHTGNPGVLEPVLTTAPPHRPPGSASLLLEYKGHSPDFSAQFFRANDALTEASAFAPEPPDPTQTGRDLYEWRRGSLGLVNVLPGNAAVAAGADFVLSSPDAHPVSANGSRVFWHVGQTVYVREDGEITRELSHSGTFLAASADGLRVLFSDGCLYSLASESCTDLSEGEGGFQGIAGQSDDLSRIYFVDTAALAPGAEARDCHPAIPASPAGKEEAEGKIPLGFGCNLYLYEEGAQTRFITALRALDGTAGALADWAAIPGTRTAEASPSGRYLTFSSTARLTGYHNVGTCAKVNSGSGSGELVLHESLCTEVYLYDSQSGELTCPSCNPTGESPLGNSTLRLIDAAPEWFPQPRYLTDSGRLYFDSGDRLSALDTNGRVEDVYEAEPAGVGSCTRAAGCVSLISPGTGSVDSNLLAVDESGANVFFTSRERLAQKDSDELIDLYDAREGGGFPAETETTRPECQGEACQAPASVPNDPTPGSSSFEGAGNVVEPRTTGCPKGKVRRKGRCVTAHKSKRHHKRHQARANRNRGGAK